MVEYFYFILKCNLDLRKYVTAHVHLLDIPTKLLTT